MIKMCIALTLCFVFKGFAMSEPVFTVESSNVRDPAAMEDVIFLYMSGSIYNAMENYYKEPRQYYKPVLLSVSRLPNSCIYEIIYSFQTFTGAHNLPFGKDTVTFWVYNGGIWVKEYKHIKIPDLDW